MLPPVERREWRREPEPPLKCGVVDIGTIDELRRMEKGDVNTMRCEGMGKKWRCGDVQMLVVGSSLGAWAMWKD